MSSCVSRGKISIPMRRSKLRLLSAGRRVAFRSFLHHRKRVAVGVLEEGHPQIVIIHLRDQMRLAVEDNAAASELFHGERDVSAAKIDDAGVIGWRFSLGLLQQQPNAGAIEERQ